MYVKRISAYREIIAISDSELIGKTFTEGIKQLDVKESFYKGDIKTPEEIKEIIEFGIKEDATFNIVGEKSTNLALEIGLIDDGSVATVDGIPYSMVLL